MMSIAFPSLIVRDPGTHLSLLYGESIGLGFDMVAGLASAVASIVILVLIFVSLTQLRIIGLIHALH